MKTDVLIVGGGAAGLLCAAFAAKRGRKVIVLEKMPRPGRKLLITGKGRCNLCNNCTEAQFLSAVRTNSRFLYSAYNAFSAQDVMALFEALHVPLKTERGGRVFPQSDRSVDIVDALVHFARDAGVAILHKECAGLILADGTVKGIKTSDGDAMTAQSVVIATGGKSYPLTGSTGDGYAFAVQSGHGVTALRPSLIPVITHEKWCRDAMGLSLKNVTLKLYGKKSKPVFEEIGEMLFTHFGVSGPLILSASAHMTGALSQYRMVIDLKPGLTHAQLDARVLRDFSDNINRDFINALGALLPRKLIPVLIKLSGIDPLEKVHSITKEQRTEFVTLMKALPITPKAFRPIEEAVITSGGVQVKEINPATMESKICKGLFFIGEVLDLDAYTGGYNLQIAFSTARLAAEHV